MSIAHVTKRLSTRWGKTKLQLNEFCFENVVLPFMIDELKVTFTFKERPTAYNDHHLGSYFGILVTSEKDLSGR